MRKFSSLIIFSLIIFINKTIAQKLQWSPDGNSFYTFSEKGISSTDPVNAANNKMFMTVQDLTPGGASKPLTVQSFTVAPNGKLLLLFANTRRVWRQNTRGDYWIYNTETKKLVQLGKGLPESSLLFAKFSPDGKKVAYVSKHNIFIENLADNHRTQVTKDGTDRMINGTFDWVYEEEFGCQDGFRWSPDGTRIAYWKLDASHIRNFLMIDNTDSLYSFTIPVEYPKVGQNPSSCTIWLYDLASGKSRRAEVSGDPVQHYIPRMEWAPTGKAIVLQQLNRAQNETRLFSVDATTAKGKEFYKETDPAWIDIKSRWNDNDPTGWDWINDKGDFLWVSEKGGWRQIYKLNLEGKESLITRGNYDVIQFDFYDAPTGTIYYTASPENATQTYLYKINLSGGKGERVTPAALSGVNDYTISTNGKIALLNHSSAAEIAYGSVISLPEHKELVAAKRIKKQVPRTPKQNFLK